MSDYIIRATAANDTVRAFACTTKELVEEARNRHHTTPVATAALGRTLTAAAMMGTMMKGDKDLLTINIKGDGPLGGIVVTADSKARVKGYVFHPEADVPLARSGSDGKPAKLAVGAAVGKGEMTVVKDMGLKEPYVGTTRLLTGEIAEDLTYYFASSEQTPSIVALGVLVNTDQSVNCAGGFIIQLMPDATEETISYLEKKVSEVTSVSQMLSEGMTPEEILTYILEALDVRIPETVKTKFSCNCTRERVARALLNIGEKELRELYEEGGDQELTCSFCNSRYKFTHDEIGKLLEEGIA